MRWGDKVEFLERERAKGALIPALEKRPALMPHLVIYMDAFHSLRYDRQIGMAAGPIPWSSLDRYAVRFDVGDFEIFESHVRALERVLMDYEAKQVKR